MQKKTHPERVRPFFCRGYAQREALHVSARLP